VDLVLGLLLVALLFLPLILIVWAFVRAYRHRNVWISDEAWVDSTPEEAAANALRDLTPVMQARNYRLTSQGESTFVFTKRYRPLWLLIPIVVFFPIGLLALIYARTIDLNFKASLSHRESGSSIAFSGRGPGYLASEIKATLETAGDGAPPSAAY
jgi:hypothetical protein